MALPVNFKDDVLASSMDGKRRYNMITNSDGTVSFEDVTTYSQEGSNFGSAQINNTNGAINKINNNVLDTIEEISANTSGGKFAGALALKNVNNSIGDISGFTNNTYDSLGSFIQYCVNNGYLPDINNLPLIPTMTSDNTPSGICYASYLMSGRKAFWAFNGSDANLNTGANYWYGNSAGQYVQYTFPNTKRIKKIRIKGTTYGLNTFTITVLCGSSESNLSEVGTVTITNNTTTGEEKIISNLSLSNVKVIRFKTNGQCSIWGLQAYGC